MKIKITMVSGAVYECSNGKYNYIDEWIYNNIRTKDGFLKLNEEADFVLNISLIERIEVFKDEN
jgi:hypothetical protein